MGFWIQSFDQVNPGLLFYVVNWSDSTWQGTGFPSPADEDYIVRSPLNGPVIITPTAQWIEMYFTIEDFNPEWVSVDLWGENIQILEISPIPPPENSPLATYWLPGSAGGIIIHECLPDSNISAWTTPQSFTTLCLATTVPYLENFDSETPPDLPNCMSVTNDNGDGITWETAAFSPLSAPNDVAISYNASLAMDDWLYTRELILTPGTYKVKFWYRSSGATYPEKLEVKWGSTPNAAGMTNGPIFDNNNIITTDYVEGVGDIVVTTAGNYYVGFHGYSDADMWYILVDDISVRAHFTWTGTVSSDWNNPSNWDRGAIPTDADLVLVPSTPSGGNFPAVGPGISAECFDIHIETGASIDVQTGGTLYVKSGTL
jgi:hypothetical protein